MAELKYNMASRVIDSQRFEKKKTWCFYLQGSGFSWKSRLLNMKEHGSSETSQTDYP